ncbi:uncharacterized protein [Littorina saxatilis]|uniref:uncharacterized protein n=1 Tax=Littorina saxatilis TaxID=31220 RepID=UPI0038B53208
MEKEEAAEDLPHVSTFHLALADIATYYRWRYVGVEQQLNTDEDIACFLLECYEKEKREKQSDRGVCLTCQSPLQLLCVHCQVSVGDTVTAITGSRGRGKVRKKSVRAAVSKADRRRGTRDRGKTGPTPSTRRGRGNNSTPDNKGDNSQPANKGDNSQPANKGDNSQPDSSPVTGARRGRKRKSSEVRKTLRHKSELPLPPLEVEVKEEEDYEESGGGRLEIDVTDTKPVHDSLPSSPQPESDAGSVERGAKDSQRGLKHEMGDGGIDIETNGDSKPGKKSDIDDGCIPTRKAKPGKKRGRTEGRFGTGTRDVDAKPGSKKRGRPRIRRAVCGECGATLTSDLTLLHHMQAQHPLAPLPPSLSLLAAKVMADDEKVKARLKRKAELASLTCATCHVTFDSKTKMSQHWKRQCQWKVCDLCGKSVKALDMHMKRHLHPKRFACPHCPKTYLFKTYLETHLLYHNREKPFCCEICGMRYYEKFRLNAHIRTHTGDKPFKCTQCDAAFTRSRGLSDHLRVHTGEKPYACQVCARQFASTGNLAAHRRKVHKLEPQVASPSKQRLLPVAGAPPPPPRLTQGGAGEQKVQQDHTQTEDGQPLTSLQPVESGQRGMEQSRFSEDITQTVQSQELTQMAQRQDLSETAQRHDLTQMARRQDLSETAQRHDLTQMARRQDLSETAQRHDLTQMARRQEMTQTAQRNDITQAAQRLDLTQIAQSHDLTQTAHRQDVTQTQEMTAQRHDAMQPHLYQDITQTKQRQDIRQISQRHDLTQTSQRPDLTQTETRLDTDITETRLDTDSTVRFCSADRHGRQWRSSLCQILDPWHTQRERPELDRSHS